MKLNTSHEFAGSYTHVLSGSSSVVQSVEKIRDSPESPDSSQNSRVFLVECQAPSESPSMTSAVLADYLDQVAR